MISIPSPSGMGQTVFALPYDIRFVRACSALP